MRPLKGAPFQAALSLAVLPRSALFSVDSQPYSVTRPALGDYLGLTIPVRGRFSAATRATSGFHNFHKHELYLWNQSGPLDYRASTTSTVLVALIQSIDLQRKARDLTGGAARQPAEVISTRGSAGGAVARFVHHFWAELQRPNGLWDCPTALAEMEDCLASLLALAASAPDADETGTARLHAMRQAEEYLLRHLRKPVARSDLAQAAGVSISTLSRGFRERHGIGPMAWLRARRLESAQRDLRTAAPGEVTVTEVALRYGFENPGRFAVEYRRTFGEAPSQSLQL